MSMNHDRSTHVVYPDNETREFAEAIRSHLDPSLTSSNSIQGVSQGHVLSNYDDLHITSRDVNPTNQP